MAIPLEMCCWSAARKLTQKNPALRINGQAREVLAGQNITSGGSRETLENDWQVIPTGSLPDIEVTTVTPVAKRPSTSRNWRARSAASGSSTGIGVCSPRRSSKSRPVPRKESISSRLGQVSRASGLIPSGISGDGSEDMVCSHTNDVGLRAAHCPPKTWPQ